MCPLHISRTVHSINFTLGGCISEEPEERGVKCEVDQMNGSRTLQAAIQGAKQSANGHCSSRIKYITHGSDVHVPLRINCEK